MFSCVQHVDNCRTCNEALFLTNHISKCSESIHITYIVGSLQQWKRRLANNSG